ncbi:hypothetical protein K470DRAFT_103811 [Piedraia hortae CBS 480.64]|uniref:Probable methionine--tRNA ligase, mitochondrial n=1 Tax=Piedraia hortae CBS 480.64 TaxID=1314780 RepID=A0A6A7C8G3_9PEZI|nr:hypothetical protein K470DRAFT_103811 [Piedraia hortae CBS 480.64]
MRLNVAARRSPWPWPYHHCPRLCQQFRPLTTVPKQKPYYLTTPMFYVNASPHLGHMYTLILSDVLTRWKRLCGRRSVLVTGTDEHGLKVQQAAAASGMAPQEFCDSGAALFKELGEKCGANMTLFVRTTADSHKRGVEQAWKTLRNKGYVYQAKHEGWYCVADECFYPSGAVEVRVDPRTGRKMMCSTETGREVEWSSEVNWHFNLSHFQEDLLRFYENNDGFIVPKQRFDDVKREVAAGLKNLSISRPVERLSWGVRVPDDASQTVYVWLDALLAYATAAGYPDVARLGCWPADVHVIGKDIVRFHAIYWPAFCLALGLPPPRQLLTHSHWTLGKMKMSKSVGNVVNPFFALERFGTDTLRWFLIHEGAIVDDADYDNALVASKYMKFLQGGLGNLESRVTRGKSWSIPRAVKRCSARLSPESASAELLTSLQTLPSRTASHMEALRPERALRTIMSLVVKANSYLQIAQPWAVIKRIQENSGDEEELTSKLDESIYLAAESLRLVGILLQPFIPQKAEMLLDRLGVDKTRRSWDWCAVGADSTYGVPMMDLGKGKKGVLFQDLDCIN